MLLGAAGGAIVGSYLATLVQRWSQGKSASSGRSRCDACGRTLKPAELIPLLSAVASGGRCRTCGARIDPLHWEVEATAAAGTVISLVLAPTLLQGMILAIFGWILLPLALLDWRHFWLPDRLTLVLAGAGLLLGGTLGISDRIDRLVGGVVGLSTLWAVAWLYRRTRGRQGLGGGDPKLLGAIGLWLGWAALPPVLLVAALTGLAVAIPGGLRATRRLPFGTMLAVSAWLVAAVSLARAGSPLTA